MRSSVVEGAERRIDALHCRMNTALRRYGDGRSLLGTFVFLRAGKKGENQREGGVNPHSCGGDTVVSPADRSGMRRTVNGKSPPSVDAPCFSCGAGGSSAASGSGRAVAMRG